LNLKQHIPRERLCETPQRQIEGEDGIPVLLIKEWGERERGAKAN
jgi:uncharacterized protein YbaR (Trm112 family)